MNDSWQKGEREEKRWKEKNGGYLRKHLSHCQLSITWQYEAWQLMEHDTDADTQVQGGNQQGKGIQQRHNGNSMTGADIFHLLVIKIYLKDIKYVYPPLSLLSISLYIAGEDLRRKKRLEHGKDFYSSFLCISGNARGRRDI